ncbi:hypothetical protein [Mesorhizobium sp. M4B.F.Ca.ET.058.02.1.1]|uniref:hypothetical protein n=1 Tax=Mesorhizobium sp. M4B.F.Ca.ET.058.02.1.1 TaxID=2493675 RepID=UPI000F759FBF|nr:hypothetical protein [Mesorhizobium sp. M4B.F.Ca.ET.058.02.1.1]AZO48054.1 hypothetical protein EJ073_09655 [Mesorhizobium sp. M4B.F.Ca.ET.058.02.1.1]
MPSDERATVLFLQNLTEQGFEAEMAYPSWADGQPIVKLSADTKITAAVKDAWDEAVEEADRLPRR